MSEPFVRYAADGAGHRGDFVMIARFALHAGRMGDAERVLEVVTDLFGGVTDFDKSNVRAGIAALQGRPAEALGLYRSALAGYRDAGCRFDVALTVLDMAALIGPDEPAVRAAIPEGREILVGLGAHSLVERLDALASEGKGSPASADRGMERRAAQPTG